MKICTCDNPDIIFGFLALFCVATDFIENNHSGRRWGKTEKVKSAGSSILIELWLELRVSKEMWYCVLTDFDVSYFNEKCVMAAPMIVAHVS